MLKLYNTLSRKVEQFKPIHPQEVGLYGCGPTVYNFAHIGNLRSYIFIDLLKRYLKYSDYKVKHVMNITDVDDKTIAQSQKEAMSLKEFSQKYLDAFLEDLNALNILPAEVMPKATNHIDDIVKAIQKLQEKGYAYEANGSIYFKISKFKNYGQLAQLEKKQLKKNAEGRLNLKDEYDKENVNDFVLWKAYQKEDGDVFWETEIGRGRPGWHIECSVMSTKYLGPSFDIHAGGVDLIFPHHTNEIAQAEAITGQPFVNFWLHNEHLLVDNKKMSKSAGTFYTLRDLRQQGVNPLILKLALLKTHYRKVLNFSLADLEENKAMASTLIEFLINLEKAKNQEKQLDVEKLIDHQRKKFKEALDNDLNIAEALSALFNFVSNLNKSINQINLDQARLALNFVLELDTVLGFIQPLFNQYKQRLNEALLKEEVKDLISRRSVARANKDFKKSDQLREEFLNCGLLVKDTPEGYHFSLKETII